MSTSEFTVNHAATVRAVGPYVCENRGEDPVPLAALVDLSRLQDAIAIPEGVCLYCEQSRSSGVQRLRVILSNPDDRTCVGVTCSFHLREISGGPESAESLALAIGRIIAHANELLPALRALKLGTARIEHEIDYRDPEHLINLLENRGCTILDRHAAARLVAEEPGPLYYGDIDLCEDGGSWDTSGGPWATRLEERLIELEALHREGEQPA
ncbi:MAG: hypothetical protein ACRDK7_15135 [Solirubrobacteraceae bacterium]